MNRDSRLSSEAAMKYFVLGALASGMLLYGMSMIYGATGTLDLAQIHAVGAFAAGDADITALLAFGVVFLVVGIGFKFGAAPFHMWLPDVYEGSPTAVTMFIGSAPKIAAFGMAYRLLDSGPRRCCRRTGSRCSRVLAVAVAGDRQRGRHRADQPQAHARVFDDLAHGLPAARPAQRHAVGLRRGDVLRDRLRDHDHGGLRRDPAARARRLRGRGDRRLQGPEPAQSVVRVHHAAGDGFARRRAAAVRLLRQAAGA